MLNHVCIVPFRSVLCKYFFVHGFVAILVLSRLIQVYDYLEYNRGLNNGFYSILRVRS